MKKLLIIFFITFCFTAESQILSVDEVVRIALKNNYGIQLARNESEISKTNNTSGNAGMLPNISVFGNGNYEINNVKQNYSSGVVNNYSDLSTTSFNAGTELSWTLFDGGKMFITKNKLYELQVLGEIQFKNKVLQTQYEVIAAYFDVVRQKQQLKLINEIIIYYTELVKILQVSYNEGSLLKTNLLQAKIDLNVNLENAINQEFIINSSKKLLNQLMGANIDNNIDVTDSIPLNYTINKTELANKLNASNSTLLSYQKAIDIERLNLKEFNRLKFPLINLKAGYYLSHTDNSAGNLLKTQSFGPQLGAYFSFPLFESGKINRQIINSKIEIESANLRLENTKLEIKKDMQNAISSFENQHRLLDIELTNNAFAKEMLEISLSRMKLGQATSLEVHQAQENYVQSSTRLINFKYHLKIAETKLKQLISEL